MNINIIELRLLAVELMRRTEPMPEKMCKIFAAEIMRLTSALNVPTTGAVDSPVCTCWLDSTAEEFSELHISPCPQASH